MRNGTRRRLGLLLIVGVLVFAPHAMAAKERSNEVASTAVPFDVSVAFSVVTCVPLIKASNDRWLLVVRSFRAASARRTGVIHWSGPWGQFINRQGRMFSRPPTVAWHVPKVFLKPGITSCSGFPDAFRSSSSR